MTPPIQESAATPSETPKTDALLLEINEGRVYETDGSLAYFARQLERELTEATARVRRNAMREGNALDRAEKAEAELAAAQADRDRVVAAHEGLMRAVEERAEKAEARLAATSEIGKKYEGRYFSERADHRKTINAFNETIQRAELAECELAGTLNLIRAHNAACVSICGDKSACGYKGYDRDCSSCAKDWMIDLPAAPQPSVPASPQLTKNGSIE